MFKCYRLDYDSDLKELIKEYEVIGEEIMKSRRESISKKLEEYIREDGFIDFTNLQDDWFPTVETDIFISHSHKDIEVINALAGWLHKNFKVRVFVDSYIWNYCDDLLRKLDETYCRHSNGESFDYDKRNFSTAHVHMMLSNALNKMIDKSECIIFLESNNSLSLKNNIEVGTSSAWIYSELVTCSLIKTNIPERHEGKTEIEIRKFFNVSESMNPLYRADEQLEHFVRLKANDLKSISKANYSNGYEFLDNLYKVVRKERVLNG
ncbi:MAG: hypothetical protein ACRCYE_14030 [Sarcina sp.]